MTDAQRIKELEARVAKLAENLSLWNSVFPHIIPDKEIKCVNAHDRCYEGGPCPLCELVRYRDAAGRFARNPQKELTHDPGT